MRRLIAVLVVLAACGRAPEPAQPVRNPKSPDIVPEQIHDLTERGNLLDIALGASAVSRTAELTLEQSAVRAIDGDPSTTWTSPPDDGANQVLVFSLPARTHAQNIGIQTPPIAMFHVDRLQIDSSLDGVNFTPLTTLDPKNDVEDPQLVAADRDLLYLRLTTLKVPGRFARINSVQVHGRWTEPPHAAPITGCWTVNDHPAQFADDRGRVLGTLGGDHPISFDGGSDGLVYRFVWVSGPNRGFAAIDSAPDGKHLSGLEWYEEPMQYSSADSWFGERTKCQSPLPHEDAATRFLQFKHRLPLYALRFDTSGNLIEPASQAGLEMIANFARQLPSQKLRLASREYRLADAQQNRRAAQARLDSLRSALQKRGIDASKFDWAVLGSENPPSRIETQIQRTLYSAIEIQTE